MANTKQTVDILRVEGIMAQGYGINPKIVMRDKRLTAEAKCIYSYLASFAGGGSQAFPGRDIMLDELQISKDRYYKHLKYLIEADYIRIDRTKQGNGAFDKNVYTIVALPNPVTAEKPNTEKSVKEAEMGSEKDQSAGNLKKSGPKKLRAKERASVNELRQRFNIDQLKLSDPEHEDIIEDVFMAVEDMEQSEQIMVSGMIKKRDAIQELLNQLTSDHILLVSNIIKNNKTPLKNRKKYLQACLINSIFDIRQKNIEAQGIVSSSNEILNSEIQKEKEQQDRERELQETYKTYPELKALDNKMIDCMRKISRAALSGDEVLNKSLQNQVQKLQEERELFLQVNGLKATI